MRTPRIYADTSVFGGVFDDAFSEASAGFFEQVRLGLFELLVSDVTRQEIAVAPDRVQALFQDMAICLRNVAIDDEVLNLRDAYMASGIVGAKWEDDAAHVAAATVAEADLVVSWNFKHIVHLDKIRLYNAVNAIHAFRAIEIRSPQEVIGYEEEV